jgi:hypothetical protein
LCNGDRQAAIREKSKIYSESFREWFGDWINDPSSASKVVDENGEPLVVYHGSPNEFDYFDKSKVGSTTDYGVFGTGFYFALTKSYARIYGENVKPFFLNLKNPYKGVFGGGVLNNDNYKPTDPEEHYNKVYNAAINLRGKTEEQARRIAERSRDSAIKMNEENEKLRNSNFDGVDATGEKVNSSEK